MRSRPARGVVRAAAAPAAALLLAFSWPPAAVHRSAPRLGPARVVERDDVGDPFVLPVPAGYVLFWTTDWAANVPAATSSDLVHWHRVADALPVLPGWATRTRTMTWAPAAVRVDGGWILYFTAERERGHQQCIGAGFADRPTGPYRDLSPAPLVCQPELGGSIDPATVRDRRGRLHLLWKSDGNAAGQRVALWEQELTADGRHTTGRPHRLLRAGRPWQAGIVEGPAMLAASGGGYWLFFSGGAWQSTRYGTGVVWCATVSGPCRDTLRRPLLASTPDAVSPGGLDTFVGHDGRLFAAYSAFLQAPPDPAAAMAENRVLEIAPIRTH